MRKKKCKVLKLIERLGLPVFLVSHTRDERDLQTNLKVENVFFFFLWERKCFYTPCLIKLEFAGKIKIDELLNDCICMGCFDAFALFSSLHCLFIITISFIFFLFRDPFSYASLPLSGNWVQNKTLTALLFFKLQKLLKRIQIGLCDFSHQ